MPTYSYACTQCDNKFDIVQSFSDDSLTECPACSGRLRKLFNTVGIVFKGSGFYRTDSRTGADKGSDSSSSSSEKSDSSAPSKSTSAGGASTSSSGDSTSSGSTSSGSGSSGSGSNSKAAAAS
ncbi:FmdB family zinc ribbon protein [Williamsia sterculiae]|uniref:Putative regulatory protein, FmdB family n=1 Tax=Williamsia sterculiae TaxID=1344003 RepID=A0A1N7DLK5_9NOCA|nr:FmdB family zinc ribbon protein [Williamsia sterculiae]SIR76641.1 putative regulatory protein, FmdB family [Williamsia sterculiae]